MHTLLLALTQSTGAPGGSSTATVPWYWWAGFLAFVIVGLMLDLLVFHREAHRVETREAAWYTAFWIGLGLAFAGVVWWLLGGGAVTEYLTGYLIEKSLSIDNIFVFVVIFNYFSVPPKYQHRVLFYGVLGALVFRGIFIAVGAALLANFGWIAYVFGAFLIFTGIRLGTVGEIEVHPEENPVLRFTRRFLPVTDRFREQRFFVREAGQLMATPLFAVLVAIETTDVIFAVDSVPAIFAVTDNTFIVFSSNAMAILGLRALYFLLADLVARFRYLDAGLAVILGLVGVKMIIEQLHQSFDILFEIPTWAPLILVVTIMTVAIVASLRNPKSDEEIEASLPGPSGGIDEGAGREEWGEDDRPRDDEQPAAEDEAEDVRADRRS